MTSGGSAAEQAGAMQVGAILCNHAEAVNNQLYLSGGGINICYFQPGSPPPYAVSVGVGLLVTVPWLRTNQQHRVEVQLWTEDGQEVRPPQTPDGAAGEPVKFEMVFNVGRPPGLQPGDDQIVVGAVNLPALPMPAAGKYEFVVNLDGTEQTRLALRVSPAPGGQMAFG